MSSQQCCLDVLDAPSHFIYSKSPVRWWLLTSLIKQSCKPGGDWGPEWLAIHRVKLVLCGFPLGERSCIPWFCFRTCRFHGKYLQTTFWRIVQWSVYACCRLCEASWDREPVRLFMYPRHLPQYPSCKTLLSQAFFSCLSEVTKQTRLPWLS